MIRVLLERLRQGHRTTDYPRGNPPSLPEMFRGLPRLNPDECPNECTTCTDFCPTDAITVTNGKPRLDMGRCIFCAECERGCPHGAVGFTREFRMSARKRRDLIIDGKTARICSALEEKMLRLFGRSLRLRQVSAGGCNACEADVNVLNTVVWDIARFGIQFAASPRHADGLLITGPVTRNMRHALEKTLAAVPSPRIVIAVGACAISGGPYVDHPEVLNGAEGVVPVDLYIPGCPPHPLTILDGILRLLGRIEGDSERLSI